MLPTIFVLLACSRGALPIPGGPVAEDLSALQDRSDPRYTEDDIPPQAAADDPSNALGSTVIEEARARHLARTFAARVDALASPANPGDYRSEAQALYALADTLSALYGGTALGRGSAWDVLLYARRLEVSGVAPDEHAQLVEGALRSAVAAVQSNVADRRDLAEAASEAEWATEAIRSDRSGASQERTIQRAFRSLSDALLLAAQVPEEAPGVPAEPPPRG